MTPRTIILTVVLGVPAAALLIFGPSNRQEIPPNRTVIRYWEKWSGIEGQIMQSIVDRFNETVGRDEGIWVEYSAISNVERRTLIATAGGDPPDVAGLYDHIVAQYADQGALLELDDLVPKYGINPDDFKPVWWDIGRYNGTLYALPSTPYTIALYYNKRLFRDAGLDPEQPPRTIEELTEYSHRLTRRDDTGRIIQGGLIPAPALLGWWHWVWPFFFDARLWDGEKFTLDTPEGRAAMRWVESERQWLGVKEALAFEGTAGAIEGPQNPFISERIAMVFQGPWVANWIRAFKPDLEYGVAAFPSVSADRQNVFVSADVFAIPRGSRHPYEAMIFLKYVLQQEVLEEICQRQCKVSPFANPRPEFFDQHPITEHIRTFDQLANSKYAFGHPQMPTFQQASTEMLYMLESILQGVRSAEKAVELCQKKVDSVVNEYQRMQSRRDKVRK